MKIRGCHLSLLSLLVTVGCFAPVPIVSAPPLPPRPEPVKPVAYTPNPAEAAAANSLTAPLPSTIPAPRPTPPVVKDVIDDLSFTELFSWSISGNTPLAAWSPNKTQLAFYSDYSQREGVPKNGKKYVEIIDLKTGKLKKVGTITGSGYEPVWLNDTTLVFLCARDLCGKDKNGVYTMKTSGGAQKLIIPLKKDSYASIYPIAGGKLMVRTEEYPPYSGSGPYPPAISLWQEWDVAAQKLIIREEIPATEYNPPKNVIVPNSCQTYSTDLQAFSQSGAVGVSNNKTAKKRAITQTLTLPYYPGDTYGIQPCFSVDIDQFLYYSYDEKTKLAKATLMKISGYTKP
jgi:hypothetical protein